MMASPGSAFINLYLTQLFEYTSSHSEKRRRTDDRESTPLDQQPQQPQQPEQQRSLPEVAPQQESQRKPQGQKPPKKKTKAKPLSTSSDYPLVSDILTMESFELVLPPNRQLSGLLELPPNVWLKILQLLPLSHMPELTLVCKHIFIIVRQKAQYGRYMKTTFSIPGGRQFKPNDHKHNILLEHRCLPQMISYYGRACDYCYRNAQRKTVKHGPYSVLPVDIRGLQFEKSRIPVKIALGKRDTRNYRLNQIFLCLPCRQDHFKAYPEPIPPSTDHRPIAGKPLKAALQKYLVPKSQVPKNPTEVELLLIARAHHGGDVGIKAERLCRLNGSAGAAALLSGMIME